ncbi:Hypp2469 [Branchiostoma lanceolatum]|uniref:Hypp2469 protein n=1 Tax=Branchiostoma lanceolatum TaxID=7740 RepID=A0A8J9ZV85_BRALA|nr:Hypp2469 [Branchiostoma lanceolatum]
MENNNFLYPGSRADWILKRAKEFEATARNFPCAGCGEPAKWVCLDAACVGYNQSRALCLCDMCDARFHITSSPVMQTHRRLAPVLYISLLLLHRYNTLLPDGTPVSLEKKRPHSPDEDDVSSSKRLCDPSTPPQVGTTDVRPLSIVTTFATNGYNPPTLTSSNGYPPPPSPAEMPQYSPSETAGSTADVMGPARRRKGDTSGIEYRATFGNNLRPIHDRYARILQHLRDDGTLTMPEAFRMESFAKLTVKNYLGIAELKLAAPNEYEAVLEAYKSRGKPLITVAGLERECRKALARRSDHVQEMRKIGQLLPFFDITYRYGTDSGV